MANAIQPIIEQESIEFDLSLYLQKICFYNRPDADLETLRALHFKHPQVFPFENLNPFLGIPVKLDMTSLMKKMIYDDRGGYCFEHNLLFAEALKTIGFNVKGLAARVLYNIPEGVITARGHMLLLVELDNEKYIADVGFGGLTLTAPLKLVPEIEQHTPHESFRLLKPAEEQYIMQAKVKDEWKTLYKFSLEEQFVPDYEVTSWYLSNHPNSHFVTGLIAARCTEEGRYGLRNKDFNTHLLSGTSEKKTIESVAELKETLAKVFKIKLPDSALLDQKLLAIVNKE